MKVKLNKNQFIKGVLSPISVLVDRAVLSITHEGTTCIANNPENNIILFIKANVCNEDPIELNIGDIKKLIRATDCVEQEQVEFDFNPGYITYETDQVMFKYHLLQPGIIQKHTIDINKINALSFNTSFDLTSANISKILRGTGFATDTNKLYFYTRDKQVYASLTDYTMSHADLIGYKVSEGFSGEELKTELPINIETFKMLQLGGSDTVRVNINTTLKVILFTVKNDLCELKYIVSGLVK